MDEATVVFSRKGLFKTSVKVRDIRSREQARKLWPLVSPYGTRQMVTWVSPSFEEKQPRRRSHFRLMPNARVPDLKQLFEDEESERHRIVQESAEYRRVKDLIAEELRRRLQAGLGMPWWFKDENASDYKLDGNLLLGADTIATEQQLSTPFGSAFRLDVAVLGPPMEKTPMILGGVEIELGGDVHRLAHAGRAARESLVLECEQHRMAPASHPPDPQVGAQRLLDNYAQHLGPDSPGREQHIADFDLRDCVFRTKLDTQSTPNWTLIPLQTGYFEAA